MMGACPRTTRENISRSGLGAGLVPSTFTRIPKVRPRLSYSRKVFHRLSPCRKPTRRLQRTARWDHGSTSSPQGSVGEGRHRQSCPPQSPRPESGRYRQQQLIVFSSEVLLYLNLGGWSSPATVDLRAVHRYGAKNRKIKRPRNVLASSSPGHNSGGGIAFFTRRRTAFSPLRNSGAVAAWLSTPPRSRRSRISASRLVPRPPRRAFSSSTVCAPARPGLLSDRSVSVLASCCSLSCCC